MLKEFLVLLSLTLAVHEIKCIGGHDGVMWIYATLPETVKERGILPMNCAPNYISKYSRYTVSWFKDGHEFYKYSDAGRKIEITVDKSTGLDIDPIISDKLWVLVNNVTMKAAGIYSCKVITASEAGVDVFVKSEDQKVAVQPYDGSKGISMAIFTRRAKIGDIVKVLCNYVLGDGNVLEHVKWYKDDELFYEYTPNNSHKHELKGINVQHYGENKIVFEVLNEKAAGGYKCEVKGSGSFGQHSVVRALVMK